MHFDQENGLKPHFGPFLALNGPFLGHHIFFSKILLLSFLLYILILLAIVLILLLIIILAILLVLDDRLVDDRVCDGWRGSERGERDSGELWVLMTCPLTRDGPSIFRAQAVKPLSVVAPPMQLVDCDSPLPWIV